MLDCKKDKHLWHNTDFACKTIPIRRECLLCNVKQKREYLGGSMWRWYVVKPGKT